jgi:hypothetical protein
VPIFVAGEVRPRTRAANARGVAVSSDDARGFRSFDEMM